MFRFIPQYIRRSSFLLPQLIICAMLFSIMTLTTITTNTRASQQQTQPDDSKIIKAVIDKPAPDFTLTDLDNNTHKLSDYKDKIVVLEWYNPMCPYVKNNHEKGPLATMGNNYQKDDDIVWLAINSNAAGQQGTGIDLNKRYRKQYKIEYPILLDEKSEVGLLYGAKTTPHMFIIDKKGILRYKGAIDNAPFGKLKENTEYKNYVENAVSEIREDKVVTDKETKSYGCGVKYPRKKEGSG